MSFHVILEGGIHACETALTLFGCCPCDMVYGIQGALERTTKNRAKAEQITIILNLSWICSTMFQTVARIKGDLV